MQGTTTNHTQSFSLSTTLSTICSQPQFPASCRWLQTSPYKIRSSPAFTMREVISLNGKSPKYTLLHPSLPLYSISNQKNWLWTRTVGQAGCQIANSCWEVSNLVHSRSLAQSNSGALCRSGSEDKANPWWQLYCLEHGIQVNTAFHNLSMHRTVGVECSLTRFCSQPDGYLTEERKAADPDQGFSTFFSETGMRASTPLLGNQI